MKSHKVLRCCSLFNTLYCRSRKMSKLSSPLLLW